MPRCVMIPRSALRASLAFALAFSPIAAADTDTDTDVGDTDTDVVDTDTDVGDTDTDVGDTDTDVVDTDTDVVDTDGDTDTDPTVSAATLADETGGVRCGPTAPTTGAGTGGFVAAAALLASLLRRAKESRWPA